MSRLAAALGIQSAPPAASPTPAVGRQPQQSQPSDLGSLLSDSLVVQGVPYRLEGTLGEGAYSCVVRGVAPDGTVVAVKKATVSTAESRALVEREFQLLTSAAGRHPNIVRCLATDMHPAASGLRVQTYAVLELCPSSIVDRMKVVSARHELFSAKTVAVIANGVGQALAHLHSQDPPVAHRDIKAENILVGADRSIKLADFGSATTLAYECKTAAQVAVAEADINRSTTMAYRAPEMADLWSGSRVDERVDVWAFGVLLCYLATFALPFEDTKLSVLNTAPTLPPPDAHNAGLLRAIRICLVRDVDKRGSIVDVLQALAEAYPDVVQLPSSPSGRARRAQQLAPVCGTATGAPVSVAADSGRLAPAVALSPASPAAAKGALMDMLQWRGGGDACQPQPGGRQSVGGSRQQTLTPATATHPLPSTAPASQQPGGPSAGAVDLFSSWGGSAPSPSGPALGSSTTPVSPSSAARTPSRSAATSGTVDLFSSPVVPPPPLSPPSTVSPRVHTAQLSTSGVDLFSPAASAQTSQAPRFDIAATESASQSPEKKETPVPSSLDDLFGPPSTKT